MLLRVVLDLFRLGWKIVGLTALLGVISMGLLVWLVQEIVQLDMFGMDWLVSQVNRRWLLHLIHLIHQQISMEEYLLILLSIPLHWFQIMHQQQILTILEFKLNLRLNSTTSQSQTPTISSLLLHLHTSLLNQIPSINLLYHSPLSILLTIPLAPLAQVGTEILVTELTGIFAHPIHTGTISSVSQLEE